ncbi:hypothetical protein [Eisenbergiella porci]
MKLVFKSHAWYLVA